MRPPVTGMFVCRDRRMTLSMQNCLTQCRGLQYLMRQKAFRLFCGVQRVVQARVESVEKVQTRVDGVYTAKTIEYQRSAYKKCRVQTKRQKLFLWLSGEM